MGKSKRLAAPREENFQTYEKDNNTNKKNVFTYIYISTDVNKLHVNEVQFNVMLHVYDVELSVWAVSFIPDTWLCPWKYFRMSFTKAC